MRSVFGLTALVSLGVLVGSTGARSEAATLASGAAEGFLGYWEVVVDFQGQELNVSLDYLDEDGQLVVVLDSSQGTQRITEITKSDETLRLVFESEFGNMSLDTKLEGDEIVGTFHFGDIEAALRGGRSERSEESTAESGSDGILSRGDPKTELQIGERSIAIRFPRPLSAPELFPIEGQSGASVLRYLHSAAVRLRTDYSLRFSDALVEAGNFAPDYPGVYSLWLVRQGTAWALHVNEEGDIWGTQHDPARDIATIELEVRALPEAADASEWFLEKTDEGGRLRVVWQEWEMVARFELVEPEPGAAAAFEQTPRD